jgi:nanoRNase/pAp phosphatase (c-di-AMP/oligoRNAs hydrolase)
MHTKRFRDLLEVLDRKKSVIIQAHDYPDYDALASGFSLLYLLETFGVCCKLCYSGEVQGFTVEDTISNLKIPAVPASSLEIDEDSQIILVDGIIGNKNVTSLTDVLTGIIDHHHPPQKIPECPFIDIRPDFGSCSTIIYQYYLETMTDVPRNVATALLMGIMMDTSQMTRGVGPVDLAAFSGLFFKGDWERAAYFLRNSFSIQDIPALRYAFDHYYRYDTVCFVELAKAVRPELLGLIADYFLRMQEIHFVVTSEIEDGTCKLSVRSEDPRMPADVVIKRALKGIGSGGGHHHMSGGSIPLDWYQGGEELRQRVLAVIEDLIRQ